VRLVRTYARLWLCWWGLLGALGLAMGIATVPTLALVGVVVTSGVIAGAVAVLPLALDNQEHISTRDLLAPALRRGLQGSLVVVTVVVSSASLGTLVVPLLALVALSSPWVIGWALRLAGRPRIPDAFGRRPASEPASSPAPGPVSGPASGLASGLAPAPLEVSDWAPAIRALSDEELCWSWRASYTALLAAPPFARLELVTLRQAYLEDLERRNPSGMRAWLDSGARAAGNPARYLAPDVRGR
jgi:hypothetical protein